MSDTMTEASARESGVVLAEGKTKIIAKNGDDPDSVYIISKDDITAGDGAKHDLIQGKAAFATRTTCNVFRLLKACRIPVAFTEQVNSTTFSAPLCTMLPYEVVIRREAHGSYLKRMPGLTKGHLFPKLLVEFFLKTNGRKWKEHDLLCDDPLMQYAEGSGEIALYEASKPIHSQKPFLVLKESEVFGYDEEWKLFADMKKIAKRVFLILEKAWQLEGRTLGVAPKKDDVHAVGSMIAMPAGKPLGYMGGGSGPSKNAGATNAALMAASILALGDSDVRDYLSTYHNQLRDAVPFNCF